jgi:hypothetical protein
MSTGDSSGVDKPKQTFNSQDFMEFLAKQDISKLSFETKSGDRFSASFSGVTSGAGDDGVFKSMDGVKSLITDNGFGPSISQPMVTLEASTMPVSKDWSTELRKDHVDVTYARCFEQEPDAQKPPPIRSGSSLPPKKREKRVDWDGMMADALGSLVEAACREKPQPVDEDDQLAMNVEKPAATEAKASPKPSKRKPRKIIPEKKEYVDSYSDADVLFGRGGRSNHHPGNKLYRDIVTEKQPFYRNCDKNEKTKVAQSIVDAVTIQNKGRFLELDKESGRWYLVPNIVARRKVGQALRENNTEQARAAKREKYGQGKANKTVKAAV